MPKYTGRHVQQLRALVVATYGNICWLCGNPINSLREFEVDHVIPRSRGGGDEIENLRPAHGSYAKGRRCNQVRNSKPAAQFIRENVELDDASWFE